MLRFALPLLALLAAALPAAAAAPGVLARGKAIAAKNCGACHAIGPTGASPNPNSPPFRGLARKYPLSNLEEALGEGIVVGHEGLDMPPFQFSPKQIEALLAYLGSIQR
jgi:cytochrome c